jgi:hypothetical protein
LATSRAKPQAAQADYFCNLAGALAKLGRIYSTGEHVTLRHWFAVLAVAALLFQGRQVLVGDETKKEVAAFGALDAPSVETARASALAWLKQSGKSDEGTLRQFDLIWNQNDRAVLDRVADTLALGDAAAARLLAEAQDPLAPAPTALPDALRNAKAPVFFRANLALAFARALSNRRVHEEALEALKTTRAELVVDPSAYLFHRAVCEHALLQRPEAGRTITRLLDDAVDAPERYKTVGALMLLDMQTWQEKDLGAVARKMDNIERRLDLSRGGPQTQKLQKEVVARLDELIKELENKAKNSSQPNGGSCPNGGQPQPGQGQAGGANPNNPLPDSMLPQNGGTGRVDQAKLRKLVDGWGKLQERERAKAVQDLTRGMSPRHREAIENYFRNLAEASIRR